MPTDSGRPAPGHLRILWVKSGPLHPLDTGGKIRTRNMLCELKRRHHVTFLALCPRETPEQALAAADEYSHERIWIPWEETAKRTARFYGQLARNLFSRLPYVIAKYASPAMVRKIQELDGAGRFDVIVCDFLTPSINMDPRLLRTPALLFQHNVESRIWQRMVRTAAKPIVCGYFCLQWRRMVAFEKASCARFAGVIGVSEGDCEVMRRELGITNVLGAVPTGVDIAAFRPVPAGECNRNAIAFLGSMDWMPNIDSVLWFTGEILPRIRRTIPEATFTIIGRNPPQKIRDLAIDTGIRVTGTVDDVRPFLAEAEVLVVPLRIGGGTRIKIFEAMATGLPIISTRIGAEGLPIAHGEDILLADTPEEFARSVVTVLNDPALRHRIGSAGRALVESRFGWEPVTRVFEEYCLQVVHRKPQGLAA